jgi:hypothetical protein
MVKSYGETVLKRKLVLIIAVTLGITIIPLPTVIVKMDNKIVAILILFRPINAHLKFIHSSELTPWIENWTISPLKGIAIKAVCISSEGAGQPSSLSDLKATKITLKDKLFCFIGVKRIVGKHVSVCGSTAVNMSLEIDRLNFEHFNYISISVNWTPIGYLFYFRIIKHVLG